jgi:hypothetical protein
MGWAAGAAHMTWISETPTKPGFYWHRGPDVEGVMVVHIAPFRGEGLFMFTPGSEQNWHIPAGEWVGPLDVPV